MMRKIKTLYNRTLLLRAMACGLILTVLLNLTGFSAQCAALEENIGCMLLQTRTTKRIKP